MFKMLDCFCGKGGWTKGFLQEGFEVTGIDILDFPEYPGRFIKKDIRKVKGKDFKDFDVIVGSPPCRNFSYVRTYHYRWKQPLNISEGLELVAHFFRIVDEANPKYWLMENVPLLRKYLLLKPKVNSYLAYPRRMKRCFWGKFPPFFIIRSRRGTIKWDMRKSDERAEIPSPIAHAFAKACKEQLENAAL